MTTETASPDAVDDDTLPPVSPEHQARIDQILANIRMVPEAENDSTPATLAEVASMCGYLESQNPGCCADWALVERQIPGFARAAGYTIEAAWDLPAAVAIPVIVGYLRANLRSDRFSVVAEALRAIGPALAGKQA